MPEVMTRPEIVKEARPPSLRDLRGVHQRAEEVYGNALHDRSVELPRPSRPPDQAELEDRGEAGQGQGHVEGDAQPGEVGAVEGRVPREDDAADAEEGGEGHVGPAGDGPAVEGGVFGGHDGGGNEERDAGVVDAGEALEEGLVRDGVHGMPHGAAHEAFAGGEEEDSGDEDVGVGTEAEVGRWCLDATCK